MTTQQYKPLARVMFLIVWVLIFCLLLISFYFWKKTKSPSVKRINNQQIEFVISPDARKHYLIDGKINGVRAKFLVDTGASAVSIPGHLARQFRLSKGAPVKVNTANGRIITYQTRINELTLGPIQMANIRALINPNDKQDEVLLGMSALKSLDFRIRNGLLILRTKI